MSYSWCVTVGCCCSLSLLLFRRVYRFVVVAAAVVRVLPRRDMGSRSAKDIFSRCRLMPLIRVPRWRFRATAGLRRRIESFPPLPLHSGGLSHLHAGVGAITFVRVSVNTGNARLVTGSVTDVLEAWIHSYGIARGGTLTGI